MAKFTLTKKAISDLEHIWEYTCESWSEKQAEKYYLLLLKACQEIAITQSLGKNYHEIEDGIWGFRSYQHIIFYQIVSPKEILVIRILHGSMDLKSKL